MLVLSGYGGPWLPQSMLNGLVSLVRDRRQTVRAPEVTYRDPCKWDNNNDCTYGNSVASNFPRICIYMQINQLIFALDELKNILHFVYI